MERDTKYKSIFKTLNNLANNNIKKKYSETTLHLKYLGIFFFLGIIRLFTQVYSLRL